MISCISYTRKVFVQDDYRHASSPRFCRRMLCCNPYNSKLSLWTNESADELGVFVERQSFYCKLYIWLKKENDRKMFIFYIIQHTWKVFLLCGCECELSSPAFSWTLCHNMCKPKSRSQLINIFNLDRNFKLTKSFLPSWTFWWYKNGATYL